MHCANNFRIYLAHEMLSMIYFQLTRFHTHKEVILINYAMSLMNVKNR